MGEFEQNARLVRERRQKESDAKSREAKNDLGDKVKISISTTMVGALSDFEEFFGFLWGHQSKEITEEQKEMKEKWDQVRDSILERGNTAIDKSRYHIDRFNIEPVNGNAKKYNYKIKVREND